MARKIIIDGKKMYECYRCGGIFTFNEMTHWAKGKTGTGTYCKKCQNWKQRESQRNRKYRKYHFKNKPKVQFTYTTFSHDGVRFPSQDWPYIPSRVQGRTCANWAKPRFEGGR